MKNIKPFKDFTSITEDTEIGRHQEQWWYMELTDGSVIDCGQGMVKDEFILDTHNTKDEADDYLNPVDGYYIMDMIDEVQFPNGERGYIEDIYEEEHPDEDSFRLIPKKDVVKKWHEPDNSNHWRSRTPVQTIGKTRLNEVRNIKLSGEESRHGYIGSAKFDLEADLDHVVQCFRELIESTETSDLFNPDWYEYLDVKSFSMIKDKYHERIMKIEEAAESISDLLNNRL